MSSLHLVSCLLSLFFQTTISFFPHGTFMLSHHKIIFSFRSNDWPFFRYYLKYPTRFVFKRIHHDFQIPWNVYLISDTSYIACLDHWYYLHILVGIRLNFSHFVRHYYGYHICFLFPSLNNMLKSSESFQVIKPREKILKAFHHTHVDDSYIFDRNGFHPFLHCSMTEMNNHMDWMNHFFKMNYTDIQWINDKIDYYPESLYPMTLRLITGMYIMNVKLQKNSILMTLSIKTCLRISLRWSSILRAINPPSVVSNNLGTCS